MGVVIAGLIIKRFKILSPTPCPCIAPAFKFCISHSKNGLFNRQPVKISFPPVLTRFLYEEARDVTTALNPEVLSKPEAYAPNPKVRAPGSTPPPPGSGYPMPIWGG